MTPREQGFLLLTSHLGDPQRNVLTVAQFRTLAQRVRAAQKPNRDADLTETDLLALGYSRPASERIVHLLSERQRLEFYLKGAAQFQCVPVSRISDTYPLALRKRLGLDSPGCLWLKGDERILQTPMISLVGCRDLNDQNRAFAEEVGRQAARQGITLVSGNARGADTLAQEACLNNGGQVISVLADMLCMQKQRKCVLYITEDGYDLPFSAQRALSRNRVIHALGNLSFVAQCQLGTGGTWDGTQRNLRKLWSPVFCYNDGSAAMQELSRMGATLIDPQQLENYVALWHESRNLFEQQDTF